MFLYRPPKGNCWGHAFGKASSREKRKLDVLFDAYFDRAETTSLSTVAVAWKSSVLPKVDWAEAFLGPENQKSRQILFIISGDRIMFPMGIVFPLSTVEPASFDFLRSFGADFPFRMNVKYFQVGLVTESGRFAWRKPNAEIYAKLNAAIQVPVN